MAVKPQEALIFISEELKQKINDLEISLDEYLNLNYNGKELEISIKDLEDTISNKEILTKEFFTAKVMIELRKRYSDWDIKEEAKKGMSLKFSEKSETMIYISEQTVINSNGNGNNGVGKTEDFLTAKN